MKSIHSPLRCAFLAAVFTVCFLRVGAAESSELGQSAGSLAVAAGVSKSEVRDAIVAALTARGWELVSKTDDRVVGHLTHRSNEATLTMIYDESKVDFFCVGWQINKKTGAHEKPEQPKSWIKYIKEDIPKFLKRAAGKK